MQFLQTKSVDNHNTSSLLTRQRLGKALGALTVGVLSIFALCAVPSYASAAVLYDNSSVDTSFTAPTGGYSVNTFVGAVSTTYATAKTQTSTGVSITGAAYIRVHSNVSPYESVVLFNEGNDTSNCVSSSGLLWTNISGSIWEHVITGCSGNIGGYGIITNATAPVTNFGGKGTGGQVFNGVTSAYIGAGTLAIQVCDSGGCSGGFSPPITDTSSRFILTTPLNEATVSSSSPVTVGAHLYINEDDYNSDQYLSITFRNETVEALGGSAFDAWNSAWGTGSTGGFPEIQIPLVTGDNNVSTTTSNFVRDGRVTTVYAVKSPTFWSSLWVIGSLFSGETLMSTTTTFIVGEKTDYDIAIEQGGIGVANTILFGTTTQGFSTSTIEAMTEACIPSLNFNLFGCAKGLIIPPQSVITNLFQQAKDGFLSYFPFGYVTRFYAIVSGTATSTLPSLSITIPAGFPSAGQTLNLTMWGKLMGQGSYLSTATSTVTGVTFYESFRVYWERFVYFVFGLGVCLRLLGMNSVVSFGWGHKEEKTNIKYKKK